MYLSVWLDAASGVSIMLFCSVQFMVVLIAAPHYGVLANWRRRRRMIPQVLTEDILREIQRVAPEALPVNLLVAAVRDEASQVNRALRSMSGEGLLILQGERISLTDQGQVESKKIMRAHRLWETYLQRAGTPLPDIHEQAHQLVKRQAILHVELEAAARSRYSAS